MGIRTPDLLHAMQALYQLSYSPKAPKQGTLDLSAAPRQCTRNPVAFGVAHQACPAVVHPSGTSFAA
jgi:hypothetical protein